MVRGGETYETIDNVASIRVVSSIRPLSTNVIHNLVLALARDAGIGDNYFKLCTCGQIRCKD